MWIFVTPGLSEEMVCTGWYTPVGREGKAPSPRLPGLLYLHVQEEETVGNTELLPAKQSGGVPQSYDREGIPRIYSCLW